MQVFPFLSTEGMDAGSCASFFCCLVKGKQVDFVLETRSLIPAALRCFLQRALATDVLNAVVRMNLSSRN